jgi:adenylate cyclase
VASRFEGNRAFATAAGIAAACIALVVAGRIIGVLQPLELLLYDAALRLRPVHPVDERVVVIAETEQDLQRYGHPLPDRILAQAIARLADGGARAIGIDKYRDVPVPPGGAELAAALARHAQVVWIMKAATSKEAGVLAPASLGGTLRSGFNDVVTDPGGVVRRGLIYLEDRNGETLYSFPLLLAATYLGHTDPMLDRASEREDWVRVGNTTVPALEHHAGGYARADMAGYQYLLDYRGMPAPFARFTLGELLDHRIDRAALQGRMVLLGSSAESLGDVAHTPFGTREGAAAQWPGVELQAHAASQLLRFALGESRAVAVLSGFWELALIAAWGVGGALLAWRAPGFLAFAAFAGLGVFVSLAAAAAAISFGWWLPLAAAALSFLLCGGTAAGQRALLERALRNGLMRIFSTHVSKEVADTLWRERETLLEQGRLRPQEITATVLFTDIRGFTPVSEQLGATKLFEWLNEYMDAMSALVSLHRGIVKQYTGDGIMAIFGAPVVHSTRAEIAQDAIDAVRCALAMGAELERLNAGLGRRGLPPISIRAGINTGTVMSGSLGGADRLEYAVVGDMVNTASRLESFGGNENIAASSCRVLISEATHELIGSGFRTRYVGDVPLKGKAEKFRVYQVLGLAGDRSQAGAFRTEETGSVA